MSDRSPSTSPETEPGESADVHPADRGERSDGIGIDPTATFTFVPIVRSGYRPAPVFERGVDAIASAGRAQIDLEVTGRGEAGETTRTVSVGASIHGPGSVTGLDMDQVVRMEPEPDTREFPPNQFPLVEFDNPELPWRYSPQRSDDNGRNRPWLCLVAVREERVAYEPAGTGPLPVIETPTDELPDPAESWAWAHAQHVGDRTPEEAFGTDSTHTRSRLMCPRNLSPEATYRACVVPTFEPGREAGLGLKPATEDGSIAFAWDDEDLVRLPVYHSWTFRTDEVGDFEQLARLLEPVEFGPGIGFETVDVSNPGPEPLKLPFDPSTETGIVGLGGALRSIGAEPITYDEQHREQLRQLLNQPHELEELTKASEDGESVGYGAVGPHLYGQWHAGSPVLADGDETAPDDYPGWFTEVNVDPRHRIAAGYGVQVVQREQERLVQSAWEQFGELRAANQKLHRLQVDELVLTDSFERFKTLSTGTMVGLTSPLHGSIPNASGTATVLARTADSGQPSELASPAFRRITRSTGPLARRPGTSVETAAFSSRLETGQVPRLTDGLDFTAASPVNQDRARAEETVIERGRAVVEPDTGRSAETDPGVEVAHPSAFFDQRADALFDATSQEAGTERQPSPAVDRTEAQKERPGGSSSEDETLPQAVVKTLAILESVDDHCDIARDAMSDLAKAIRTEDDNAVDAALTGRPTVLDRTERIGDHTFDPLAHALGKLLVEPRPAPVGPEFDQDVADERLGELRQFHRRCVNDVARAVEALRIDPANPRTAQCFLNRAKDAVTCMEGVTMRIESGIDAADALTGEAEPEIPLEELGSDAVSLERDAVSLETGEDEADVLGAQPIGRSAPRTVSVPDGDALKAAIVDGFEPTTRLHQYARTALGIPTLEARDHPVRDVLVEPTVTEPAYRLLAELGEEHLLPGKQHIPTNSVGTLVTNAEFIEAFMTGLNHEMARELQWHRFPTDRRGTYFRRFWNRKGHPDRDSDDPEAMADIEPIHTWTGDSLGEHSRRDGEAMVVLLVKGELLRRYPKTDVFAAKAVDDEGDRSPALPQTHVVPDDAEAGHVAYPEFRGELSSDVSFFGFPLTVEEALYAPYTRDTADGNADEGWFFVLQEPPGEPRFGLDVGTEDDVGEVPPGITDGDGRLHQLDGDADAGTVDHGWSAVSWAHLVDDGDPNGVDFVDVADARPGRESWRVEPGTSFTQGGDHEYTREDAATWGHNSAHMAITSWIRPVRVSIHAADMVPDPHRTGSVTPAATLPPGRDVSPTRSRGRAADAKVVDYPRPTVGPGGDE